MFTEINKISNIIVKLENKIEACHPKHTKKRARLLRRALLLVDRLERLISIKMNELDSEKFKKMAEYQLDWMRIRVRERVGRITQKKEKKACLLVK